MNPIDPALEREYNNRAMVPEHPAIFDRWRRQSADVRAHADCTIDLAYGLHPRHRLDVFRVSQAIGTVVFIHGGYWRSLDKSDFSFIAGPMMSLGLSVAAINYRLCPEVALSDIIDDCSSALDWLADQGAVHGLNLSRVALAGHSAGGHLVASLFARVHASRPAAALRVVGGTAVSGVFDLEPLVRCSMNTDLQLDAKAARALSPVHLQPALHVPLHLSVGAAESKAFLGQTLALQRAWPGACQPAVVLERCNHFTVVDEYFRAGGAGQAALRTLFD
jgi:arylformamidase